MSNLFVVNTTFQLLTAYILARNSGSDNYLLILHPPNHISWTESQCLNKILKDKNVWRDQETVVKWFERLTKVKDIKAHIAQMYNILERFGPIDNVFLGCDRGYQRQLIVEMTGNSQFYRFDEGFGTYWSPKRPFFSKLYLRLRVSLFRFLAGVKTQLKYNYDGIGWSQSAKFDYVFRPELVTRPSPGLVKIERDKTLPVVEHLTDELDISDYDSTNGCVWYLGNTLAQTGAITEQEEIESIKNALQVTLDNGCTLVYKAHPSECTEKLGRLKNLFPDIKFYYSYDPVELVLAKCKNLRCIITHITSSLIFLDSFCTNPVKVICPLKLVTQKYAAYSDEISQMNLNIVERAGVPLPNTMDEFNLMLAEYIQNK